ncbi:hypothetical protein FQR65_LT14528 [Abscondita terminalis]|nr:hypothetical protein FQR65_LT14528 [Abscondita terminalis]
MKRKYLFQVPAAMIVEATLILGAIQLALGDREHKVHNIVLYPERYSWCKTTPIKQVVASPGYKSVTIDNNVCVGACYSYSIPITQPAEPGELIRPYCDSCQPVKTRCYHVTLNADGDNTDGPKKIQKRIQIITKCLCMSCEKLQDTDCEDEKTSELPADLFSILHPESVSKATFETKLIPPEEVPELLQFAPTKTTSATKREHKFKISAQLMELLKSIQNADDLTTYNRNQMKELLQIFEDSNHELDDKKLLEFINFIEDVDLDLPKLKDVLVKFKKSEEVLEKQAQDLDDGIEDNHLSSIAMGPHHHHAGEPQRIGLDLGHLVRGPHGSLAFTPNVQEKLSLESDLIKPNQEGTVISYENSHTAVN